jgi:hypothetical protein
MIVTHFGINNQTFWRSRRIFWNWWVWSRKKPGIFFHDAWNDALVLPEKTKNSV